MTFDINLPWQSFSVDLNTVNAWMVANAGAHYCGLSANSMFQAHFTQEPGDELRVEIASYWSALNTSSPEHTNYVSEADRVTAAASAKAAKLASATSKLEILGLTADEIAAIVG